MAFCQQCNKWLSNTPGKRTKQFCNNTCRSNYWYAKNIKDKVILAPPQEGYDAPQLPENFKEDEPLSFDRLKQEAAEKGSKADYELRLHTAKDGEELQQIGREIDRSSLPRFEKQRLHAIGQSIYNDKFNF